MPGALAPQGFGRGLYLAAEALNGARACRRGVPLKGHPLQRGVRRFFYEKAEGVPQVVSSTWGTPSFSVFEELHYGFDSLRLFARIHYDRKLPLCKKISRP
mgnify:CR=1 FL=1